MTCIVTDSTADIPPDVAAELGIRVVPAIVTFGLQALRDGVDIDHDEFYARLAVDPSNPTTAHASSGTFTTVYRELAREDPEIVSVHVAASLSGTVNAARLGAELAREAQVSVVDSGEASMAIGLQVIEAARAARAGATRGQIVELLNSLRPRTVLVAAIDTLDYLRRSGRVGRIQAVVGNLIHLKPMVVIHDGVSSVVDKVISSAASEAFLMTRLHELRPLDQLWILHAAAYARARAFAEKVSGTMGIPLPPIAQVGSVMGTHTGPGAVGFAAIRAARDARAGSGVF